MRRRSYQKPRIKNKGGYWIAQFRDLAGKKRKVSLGPVVKIKKTTAEHKLDRLLEPINHHLSEPTSDLRFGEFVRQTFLPFYRRKWKSSTIGSNENRINKHLQSAFADSLLTSFTRDELQRFLDQKAANGLSHSMVAH